MKQKSLSWPCILIAGFASIVSHAQTYQSPPSIPTEVQAPVQPATTQTGAQTQTKIIDQSGNLKIVETPTISNSAPPVIGGPTGNQPAMDSTGIMNSQPQSQAAPNIQTTPIGQGIPPLPQSGAPAPAVPPSSQAGTFQTKTSNQTETMNQTPSPTETVQTTPIPTTPKPTNGTIGQPVIPGSTTPTTTLNPPMANPNQPTFVPSQPAPFPGQPQPPSGTINPATGTAVQPQTLPSAPSS